MSDELENFFAEDLAAEREELSNPGLRVSRAEADLATLEAEEAREEDQKIKDEKKQQEEDIFSIKIKRQKNWLTDTPPADAFVDKRAVAAQKEKSRKKTNNRDTKYRRQNKNKHIQDAIQIMTATGIKPKSIQVILGLSEKAITEKYSMERDYGKDILTTRIVNALVQRALEGNVPAITLYLKSQAGWRDSDKELPQNIDQLQISEIERNQRMMAIWLTMKERGLLPETIEVIGKDVFD